MSCANAWEVETSTDKMSDIKSVIISDSSKETVLKNEKFGFGHICNKKDWYFSFQAPDLFKTKDTYKTCMSFRFNKEPQKKFCINKTDDNKRAITFKFEAAYKFLIDGLKKEKDLLISYSSLMAGDDVVVTFSGKNFPEKLKECGKK